MHNFDVARLGRKQADRMFVICGQQFTAKAGVRPEVLAIFERVTEADTTQGTIDALDEFILAMIEDTNDAHTRWRQLRANEDDVLDLRDIRELSNWLIGAVTGVDPTSVPSGSQPGAAPAGTAESSPLPVPSAASTPVGSPT